jgi:hypothetical protein
MILHEVDPNARTIDGSDLACWLLFYLEAHGAEISMDAETTAVRVNLDPIPHLTAEIVARWGPTIAILLDEFRHILLARLAAAQDAAVH